MPIGEIRRLINNGLVPLNKLIGNPGDTGGSTTVGTVTAKVNKALTDIADAVSRITSLQNIMTTARGGNIDRIANGTYGIEALKNLLDKVFNNTGKYYVPSSTVIQNLAYNANGAICKPNSTSTSGNWYYTVQKISDNFIPKADGILTVSGTLTAEASHTGADPVRASAEVQVVVVGPMGYDSDTSRPNNNDNAITSSAKSKGTNLKNNSTDTIDYAVSGSAYSAYSEIDKVGDYGDNYLPSKSIDFSFNIKVAKGYPVYVVVEAGVHDKNSSKGTCVAKLTALQVKGTLNSL